MRILFFLIIFYSYNLLSQNSSSRPRTVRQYFKYISVADSNSSAGLFNFRYQYLFTPRTQIFRRGGTSANIGFNLARLFTRKFILGFCIDTKVFIPSFIKHKANSDFITDFNNEFVATYDNDNDSLRASVLFDGINNQNNVSMKGSFPFYYGFSFSPFPQKWGGFLLEIKKGGNYIAFYGNYDGKLLNKNGDNSALNLATNDILSIELSFKPNKFVRPNPECLPNLNKAKGFLDIIVISLYYERFNLKSATFGEEKLNTFVSEKFTEKYSNQNYFGIKLGIGIY